jgi:pyruvate formate lyase activating enzyme
MPEALLFERLPDDRVRCNTCQWRCVVSPGKTGVCRMYQNQNGTLYNLNYALASSVAVDPIEKKPLYHFHPGTEVYSLGGWGCNFHCTHCQNWEISCPDAGALEQNSRTIPPEKAVSEALRTGCHGIAWTYNEPTMWFEYTLDTAKLAKARGLYKVYVTNGYATSEALDAISPYLDAWRLDIKGFNDKFYRDLAKITRWRGILDVAERAQAKWHMHVEVITNIIPTMNDDDAQLAGIAGWIKENLGELTPWHVTRFYPHRLLKDIPPTPVATLERALAIGLNAGLKFVYVGNIPGHQGENTVCYRCGRLIIQRLGFAAEISGLNGSKCKYCGAELNIVP